MSNLFPLGYKEGFGQWVATTRMCSSLMLTRLRVGKCITRNSRTQCHVIYTVSQKTANPHANWDGGFTFHDLSNGR